MAEDGVQAAQQALGDLTLSSEPAPEQPQASPAARQRGTVRWFNASKGYGFVQPEGVEADASEGHDLFCHQTSIRAEGFRSLREGEEVEFDVDPGEDGRHKAVNVTGPGGAAPLGAPKRLPLQGGRRGGGQGGGPSAPLHQHHLQPHFQPAHLLPPQQQYFQQHQSHPAAVQPALEQGQQSQTQDLGQHPQQWPPGYGGYGAAQYGQGAYGSPASRYHPDAQQLQAAAAMYYGRRLLPGTPAQWAGQQALYGGQQMHAGQHHPHPAPQMGGAGRMRPGPGQPVADRRPPPGTPGVSSGFQVVVHNLPWTCSWQQLKDAFLAAGVPRVERADVIVDSAGRSRGFGTVLFETSGEADAAVEIMNNADIGGRAVTVRIDRFA